MDIFGYTRGGNVPAPKNEGNQMAKKICSYCKCEIKNSLGLDLIPICGKTECRQQYLKDRAEVFEMLANIGGRTTK